MSLDEHQFEFLRTEQYDRWLGFKREDLQQWFTDKVLNNVTVDCVDRKCNSVSNQGNQYASVTIFAATGEKSDRISWRARREGIKKPRQVLDAL